MSILNIDISFMDSLKIFTNRNVDIYSFYMKNEYFCNFTHKEALNKIVT